MVAGTVAGVVADRQAVCRVLLGCVGAAAVAQRRYMAAPPRIAFFDLDRTLISRNSATLWLRSELANGRLSRLRALHAFTYVVRYSLGLVDIEDAIRRSVTTIAGQNEAEMAGRAVDFYGHFIRPIFRPGGRAALDAHRAAGDRLVLLTSSSNYVAEQVVRDLALDDFLCSRFEVDADGRYTGRLIEPLCYGRGKVELARRCADIERRRPRVVRVLHRLDRRPADARSRRRAGGRASRSQAAPRRPPARLAGPGLGRVTNHPSQRN